MAIEVKGVFSFQSENGERYSVQLAEKQNVGINADIRQLLGDNASRQVNAFISLSRKPSESELKAFQDKLNKEGYHIYTLQTNFPFVSAGQARYGIDATHNQVANPTTGELLPVWRYSVVARNEQEAYLKLKIAVPGIDLKTASYNPVSRTFMVQKQATTQPQTENQTVEDLVL